MSDETRQLAGQAAEAIRSLNHLTRGDDALEYPGDVYEVVASLRQMAERLPQLLAQLASWLKAEGDAGRVGHDGGDDAREQIGQVIAGLSVAITGADEMAVGLQEAHNSASGLRTAR